MAINEQLILEIRADVAQLKKGIAKSKASVGGLQNSLKGVSGTIKTAFVAALALAARQAIKSGMDFDKSMTKIKALVGVASDEVDRMGKRAKQMSSDIGVSSNEAADALFFITSAGLKGAEAMDVLEASLKASAIGLGETKTVADLATSALNAYKGTGLTAVGATDVLTAAVREGKLEASELASSMGRVLPVASAMGVKFHEVGAAFAAMSRTGTNASEAATSIKSILVAINKPTEQAKKQLSDMGISAEFLRQKVKDEGLLSVLQLLKERFEGNIDAQNKVFSGQQAMLGVMDLLGSNAAGTAEIFDSLSTSTGALGTAYDIVAESDSKKLDKALTQLSNQLTHIGTIVLPPLVGMIEVVGSAMTGFAKIAARISGNTAYVAMLEAQEEALRQLDVAQEEATKRAEELAEAQNNLGHELDMNGDKNIPGAKDAVVEISEAYNDYLGKVKELENEQSILGSSFDMTAAKIDLMRQSLIDMLNAGEGSTGAFNAIKSELATLEAEEMGIEADLNFNMDDDSWIDNDTTLQNLLANTESWGESLKAAHEEINNSIAEEQKEHDAEMAAYWDEKNAALREKDQALLEERRLMFEQTGEFVNAFTQTIGAGLMELSNGMIESLGLADKGVQGFVKSMLKALAQVAIAQLVGLIQKKIMAKIQGKIDKKQAMGSGIAAASNTAAAMGPAGAAALPTLIAAAMGTVAAAFGGIQAFAKGGIVTKPMMGLVGEAGGEAIIPLDRLENMVGPTTGEFTLRGQDLVLALNRADNFKDRIMN